MNELSDAELEEIAARGAEAMDELEERRAAKNRANYDALSMAEKIQRRVMFACAAHKDEHGDVYMMFADRLPFKRVADLPFPKPLNEYTNEHEAIRDLWNVVDSA